MIRYVDQTIEPVHRLVAACEERGLAGGSDATTWIAGLPAARDTREDPFRHAPRLEGGRLLIVTPLGTHRDSPVAALRDAWRIEEAGRSLGLPVLTLRLAPLVGPGAPFWNHLRSNPALPRDGRGVLQPVHEEDVIETLARALDGRAEWEGWYEVVGREVVSLAELRARALAAGPALPCDTGHWEPVMEILAAQRLAEPEPWIAHFGVEPRPLPSPQGRVAA